ncbi:MAG: hypothetical protein LH479_02550 [Polaromonas sp.]|nr:hypothetical protein [Polaromonas sp.]
MQPADFSARVARRTSAADFVDSDAASLASHMHRCASSHGRFFAFKTGLQSAHATLSSRVVTVGAGVFVGVALIAIALV